VGISILILTTVEVEMKFAYIFVAVPLNCCESRVFVASKASASS
jgi:hypothetical protein